MKVINCTSGHPFTMEDGTIVPFSGTRLDAELKTVVTDNSSWEGVQSEQTDFHPTAEGLAFLETVPADVVIVGSINAAKAYDGPRVIAFSNSDETDAAMKTARETGERFDPANKLMSLTRYNEGTNTIGKF